AAVADDHPDLPLPPRPARPLLGTVVDRLAPDAQHATEPRTPRPGRSGRGRDRDSERRRAAPGRRERTLIAPRSTRPEPGHRSPRQSRPGDLPRQRPSDRSGLGAAETERTQPGLRP